MVVQGPCPNLQDGYDMEGSWGLGPEPPYLFGEPSWFPRWSGEGILDSLEKKIKGVILVSFIMLLMEKSTFET